MSNSETTCLLSLFGQDSINKSSRRAEACVGVVCLHFVSSLDHSSPLGIHRVGRCRWSPGTDSLRISFHPLQLRSIQGSTHRRQHGNFCQLCVSMQLVFDHYSFCVMKLFCVATYNVSARTIVKNNNSPSSSSLSSLPYCHRRQNFEGALKVAFFAVICCGVYIRLHKNTLFPASPLVIIIVFIIPIFPQHRD